MGWEIYLVITFITIVIAHLYSMPARQLWPYVPGLPHCRFGDYRRVCLASLFMILFLLSAFRLNVGNDYATYVEFMHRLYTDKYIPDPGVPTEWGFNLLARFVYFLSGYENYVLVFAIYAAFTIWFFIKAIDGLSVDFSFSFFLFMTLGYYFQSFSTVRYYLALSIALYSIRLVRDEKWLSFVLLILIGSGFHKSLLVVLVLYPVAYFVNSRWQVALICLFSTTGLFLKDQYMKTLLRLYPSYEGTEYLAGSGFSWVSIIRCVLVLALASWVYYNHPEYFENNVHMNRACYFMNVGALLLYMFWSFLPIVSRIGYYLTVCQLIYVPWLVLTLLENVSDVRRRRLVMGAVGVACLAYFAAYLGTAGRDGVLIVPYRTFFFHDMVDILSNVG